jgi:hypothetical protein
MSASVRPVDGLAFACRHYRSADLRDASILIREAALLIRDDRWCQRALAETADGHPCWFLAPAARRWSASGALARVADRVGADRRGTALAIAESAIRTLTGRSIVALNDDGSSSAELVREALLAVAWRLDGLARERTIGT